MKALSIKNPFAGLVVTGAKLYEVRSFKTSYRGELVICSTKKDLGAEVVNYSNPEDYPFRFDTWKTIEEHEVDSIPNGCAVGIVQLVDVIKFTGTKEQEAKAFVQLDAAQEKYPDKQLYLWVFSNPKKINPVPVKGRLGIFNLDIKL
jgi:hypothetical protein